MDAQIETTNPMQETEAYPLEDRSLPAEEVLAKQQSDSADQSYAPTFIP